MTRTSVARKEDTSTTDASSVTREEEEDEAEKEGQEEDEEEEEEHGESTRAASRPEGRRGMPELCLQYSVKNGFVHFANRSDGGDSSDSEPELPIKELPPPLDFLPAKVSFEKLQHFRVSYQKFRAGNASGAKGEITSTLPRVASWPSGS